MISTRSPVVSRTSPTASVPGDGPQSIAETMTDDQERVDDVDIERFDDPEDALLGLHARVLSNCEGFSNLIERMEGRPWEAANKIGRLKKFADRREGLSEALGDLVYRWMAVGGGIRLVPPSEFDADEVRDRQVEYRLRPVLPDREEAVRRIDAGEIPPMGEIVDIAERVFNDFARPLPGPDPSKSALKQEVDWVYDVLALEEWSGMTRDLIQIVASHLTARCNYVQASEKRGWDVGDDLHPIYPQMTAFVGSEGHFVHGLAQDHEPLSDSWREDAIQWRDHLRERIDYWKGVADSG